MDRLTELHYDRKGHYMKCSGFSSCDGHCGNCDELDKLVDRLAAIEDILGDTYDLDHLRELMEADKRPLKPGDEVYWLLEDDGWYVSDGEKVADVGTMGFYLGNLDGSMCDHPSFIPWDDLGKNCFLSQEAAEAAMAKMKEE